MEVNAYTLDSLLALGLLLAVRLCYEADVKLARFRSQLQASHVSNNTERCDATKQSVCGG